MPSRTSGSVLADRPRRRPEPAGLGGLAQVVDGLDAELGVELADGLGAEARDAQQLDEARRDLGAEPVVVGHVAGRRELLDLVADRLADARDLGRLAGPVGRHEVDRAAADGVGRAVVGDRLEDELALDLEHVADLVEDPGEVAVGQVGRVSSGGSAVMRPDGSPSGGDDPGYAATTRSRPALGPIERPVGLLDEVLDRLVRHGARRRRRPRR